MTKEALKNCRIPTVSVKFLQSVEEFLTHIADESDRVKEIIYREGDDKETTEQILRNFTHITRSQF
jgi:hypothetical protein